MEITFDLDVLFGNILDWKGIQEKAVEVNSTAASVSNSMSSQWVLTLV
jgi:hypothetical protein